MVCVRRVKKNSKNKITIGDLSPVNGEILRLGVAIFAVIVIDTVRSTPQIVTVILPLLLQEERVTQLKRLTQMDAVVVDAVKGRSGGGRRGRHRHGTVDAGHLLLERFRQILRHQFVDGRRRRQIIVIGRG